MNDIIQMFARSCKNMYTLSFLCALKKSDRLFKCSQIKEKLPPSAVIEIASQACRIRREIGHGCATGYVCSNESKPRTKTSFNTRINSRVKDMRAL